MIICSPIGKTLSQGFVPPRRPETLSGLRFGLLDNTKAPVDHMLRRILFADSQIPLGRFSTEIIERRLQRKFAVRYADTLPDARVPVARKPEDIMIIVAGGPGKHSMYVPTFGGTRSVTRSFLHVDGRPWHTSDFE
jgi:hypothetical protein